MMCFKVTRKHGMTKRAPVVEQGTTKTGEVDFEWIPRDVLNSMFIHLFSTLSYSIQQLYYGSVCGNHNLLIMRYNIHNKCVDFRQEVS